MQFSNRLAAGSSRRQRAPTASPRPLRAGADVTILDLKDSVTPKDKAEARKTALEYLAGNPVDGVHHALRINGLDTAAGISDLNASREIYNWAGLTPPRNDSIFER